MSLKTIKVNPIFLSGGENPGFSVKNKTRKEKPNNITLGQANNIKKKLITRIQNFQKDNNKQKQEKKIIPNIDNTIDNTINNDVFSNSLNFLDNLARDKNEKKREKRKNSTLKKHHQPIPAAYMNIATELPPELDWNTISPPKNIPVAQFAPVATVVNPNVGFHQ